MVIKEVSSAIFSTNILLLWTQKSILFLQNWYFSQLYNAEDTEKYRKSLLDLFCFAHNNMKKITCSWHQKTNPSIRQFANPTSLIKPLFHGVLVLIYYLKSFFFHFKDILQHFKFVIWRIGEFVCWCNEQINALKSKICS